MEAKPTQFRGRRLELEKSVFKNSSILVSEIGTKVEEDTENDDREVLVTALNQYTKKICKKTFLDGNSENPPLLEWVTVEKSQMIETLSTNTEAWWKNSSVIKEEPPGAKPPPLVPSTCVSW